VTILILIGLFGLAAIVATFVSAARVRESREQQLRREVLEADRQVHEEYRNARRAMNIASGQAWRNLTN